MQVIQENGRKLAIKLGIDDFVEGLSFFTDNEDYLQVGTWNYAQGKILKPHNHNRVSREIHRTQEVVVVFSGRIRASVYNEEDIMMEMVEICSGEILILLSGGHGYEILESGTRVLEVKNGPYPGAEVDRRRLAS